MPIKSPFPGLDPYLETHWGDVRHSFVVYSCHALQADLPHDLVARVSERVFVEVIEHRSRSKPQAIVYENVETTDVFIEIREATGGKVVTVIEFLSPANKIGAEGTTLYRQKQREVMLSDTSLVEIDLVRTGQRVLAMNPGSIDPSWANDSLVLVRRGWQGNKVELFHIPLRSSLSPVPIPLRRGDKPVYLDLQSLHDECYQKGRYDRLDYSAPPQPPLRQEDAVWADEVLAVAGKRVR